MIDCRGRLTLLPLDETVAELVAGLGANYGLKPADSIHLASAVHGDAHEFVTNNRNDFDQHKMVEVEIVYSEQLE